ncbi:MAG: hypothetical protein IKC32_07715 [Clostridia bacterium]|nr:hypothetical protein [Clostridia bacterium]
MGKLKIKDIMFGKIDGYNEFLEYGDDACKQFFFEFPNVDINKVLNGSVYYICGEKGTGKTMLLKYLESRARENPEVCSEFIRFKKEVDEDQRNQLKRASLPTQPFEEIIDKDVPLDSTIDCTLAWQVYLIKCIVFTLEKSQVEVFDKKDIIWKNLSLLLRAMYSDSIMELALKNGVKKILPKIKKGNIELNLGLGKLDFELEWNDESKRSVSFSYIAKKAIELYSNLTPTKGKFYVFIDELELSLKKTKKYERDITLIRDLIFAIQYLSEISKQQKYNIYLITAIRNDVYRHVSAKGLEINKPIHDYGIQISWQQKGGNIEDHPLLKMLEKKINYSEKAMGVAVTKNIWSEYFTNKIHDTQPQTFVLRQTWHKPRDLIRLFNIIQEIQGEKTIVNQETFERVRQRYAEESWSEMEETLTVTYSDKEVIGIRQVLTGIRVPFTLSEFISAIDGKKELFDEVDVLDRSGHKPLEILRDLYDIGVIGNYGNVPRFIFLGDQEINPMASFTLHYPLLKFFGASIKRFEKSVN